MYLSPEKGKADIICDACKKKLADVTVEYIIVSGLEHYCPACFNAKIQELRKEYYRQRIMRIKEKRSGKRKTP